MASGHAGDSSPQQQAEGIVRELLSNRLGVTLEKRRFAPPEGNHLEVDAASEEPLILAEIWAHQGKLKGAQPSKVMTDAMKLVFARSFLTKDNRTDCRLVLCFADDSAADHFKGNSWMAQAIRNANVEIVVIDLPEEAREQVRQAQTRQYR